MRQNRVQVARATREFGTMSPASGSEVEPEAKRTTPNSPTGEIAEKVNGLLVGEWKRAPTFKLRTLPHSSRLPNSQLLETTTTAVVVADMESKPKVWFRNVARQQFLPFGGVFVVSVVS
jgi:hypothetical protein